MSSVILCDNCKKEIPLGNVFNLFRVELVKPFVTGGRRHWDFCGKRCLVEFYND